MLTAFFMHVQGDHLQLLLQGLHLTRFMPSHEALMGISAGLFLPTTWLPDLGALSYVGALGVVSALGLTGGTAVLPTLHMCFCIHCIYASTRSAYVPLHRYTCINNNMYQIVLWSIAWHTVYSVTLYGWMFAVVHACVQSVRCKHFVHHVATHNSISISAAACLYDAREVLVK